MAGHRRRSNVVTEAQLRKREEKRRAARRQASLEQRFGKTIKLGPLNVPTTAATVRAKRRRKLRRGL